MTVKQIAHGVAEDTDQHGDIAQDPFTRTVSGNHLFIRLDLSNGQHIGPGKSHCSKRFGPNRRRRLGASEFTLTTGVMTCL
jgi:hypothetical protein